MEWFDQVDAANRSDLRDLARTVGAGLDAKLEQIRAELRAELHREFRALRSEPIEWTFVLWGGSVVTTTVLVLAVVGALGR